MENDYSKRFEQIEAHKSGTTRRSGQSGRTRKPIDQELIYGIDTSDDQDPAAAATALTKLTLGAAPRSSAARKTAAGRTAASAGTTRRSTESAAPRRSTGESTRRSSQEQEAPRRSAAASQAGTTRKSSSQGSTARKTASGASARQAAPAARTARPAGSAPRKKSGRRRRRRLRLAPLVLMAVVAFLILALLIRIIDKPTITLNVQNEQVLTAQYGMEDTLPQVTATYTSRLFHRKGMEVPVTQSGDVALTTFGTYPVTYKASYKGAKATAKVSIEVVDTKAPTITLVSADDFYTPAGSDYVEEGYTATDNYDGDLTEQVVSSTNDGVVTYTVTDSNGNTATATRQIKYADKIVYLTFDDGPGQYTDQLLDTLKKYNAKATFFVTNQFPNYQDCIKREAEEGHTVAIHSYTHDFATIYTGIDAFFADVKQMSDIIVEQTGITPTLLRFPGGSDNSVSKKYCEGIMTNLCDIMKSRGYQYVDWNVTSGDADGQNYSAETLADNIIKRMQDRPLAIVLQHDIKKNSVDAVETVLQWGQANGYTFLALTDTSYAFHFSTLRN